MFSQKMILIFALPLLAACADRDLVAPGEDGAVIQAAKGGNKGKPGGGSDDGGGTWDGKQDIVYVESFSKGKSEDRLIVVNSDGFQAQGPKDRGGR